MTSIQRSAASSSTSPVAPLQFLPLTHKSAQDVLTVFNTANPELAQQIATSGGSLTAYLGKNGEAYVLANPTKSPAVLYRIANDGKASRIYDGALSDLPRLYNEKADTESGHLKAALRDAFYKLQNFPQQRPPGAPIGEREREQNEAANFIAAQGSENLNTLNLDSLDADSDPSKREQWQRNVEAEIQLIAKNKRASLIKDIAALEGKFDTASVQLGGTK